ncbi:hypothetical protein HZS_6173 [Henneguya salminicola]|nr:hypothetical protein HZS_6173 [Henneguya salminicola]
MYIPRRILACISMFICLLACYFFRACMSVTILTMASLPTSTTATTTQTHGDTCSSSSSASGSNLSFTPRLTWTNDQQGNILSAYFYGYMFANFPGAIMADLLGPRLTMSIGLSGATLFTFLIVPCAQAEANIAYILIIICRVAIGIFCGPLYASIHGLLACWVPKEERTKLAVITHSGNIFGLIVTFTVGAFIDTTEKGWEYFLYFGGALGIFSLVLWLLFIYDKPWLHPHIREDERKLIVNSLYSNIIPKPDTIRDIPFKSLLTSYAVLITSLAHLANNFILYMFLTNHPKYLKTVYHVSSRQATLMTNIPFIVNFLFQMLASWGTNYLQCKYPLKSTTFFRKCVGFIG